MNCVATSSTSHGRSPANSGQSCAPRPPPSSGAPMPRPAPPPAAPAAVAALLAGLPLPAAGRRSLQRLPPPLQTAQAPPQPAQSGPSPPGHAATAWSARRQEPHARVSESTHNRARISRRLALVLVQRLLVLVSHSARSTAGHRRSVLDQGLRPGEARDGIAQPRPAAHPQRPHGRAVDDLRRIDLVSHFRERQRAQPAQAAAQIS